MLAALLQIFGLLTLHTAAQQANIPVMRQMIENHADVNAVDKKGVTPLFYTANLGTVEGARLLLEHGADINHTTPGGGLALHSALLKQHEALSIFFIEQGANVNQATKVGVTPLHMAAQNAMPNVVKHLLQRGADPKALTAAEQSPMLIALQALQQQKPGADATVRLLLDAGAEPEKTIIELFCTKLAPEHAEAFAESLLKAIGPDHQKVRDLVDYYMNKRAVDALGGKLQSPLLGELTQSAEEYLADWWYSTPVEIPFWNGLKLPVVYEFNPAEDPEFIKEADAALTNFLKKTAEDRLALTPLLRENCENACVSTDFTEEEAQSWLGAESGEGLWAGLQPPEEIIIKRRDRRDKDVYISMVMPCGWSDSMAFVYRQGRQLTRLSYADGWLTEADAFNTEDAQDELLSRFNGVEWRPLSPSQASGSKE